MVIMIGIVMIVMVMDDGDRDSDDGECAKFVDLRSAFQGVSVLNAETRMSSLPHTFRSHILS